MGKDDCFLEMALLRDSHSPDQTLGIPDDVLCMILSLYKVVPSILLFVTLVSCVHV